MFTPRQINILALLAVGATDDEIAHKLGISLHTVMTETDRIYKKIDVSDRLQASLWAVKNLKSILDD